MYLCIWQNFKLSGFRVGKLTFFSETMLANFYSISVMPTLTWKSEINKHPYGGKIIRAGKFTRAYVKINIICIQIIFNMIADGNNYFFMSKCFNCIYISIKYNIKFNVYLQWFT